MTQVPGLDGLVVVDKPQDWTSHDVVARVRRLAGTRKVGHAGTLDPMATGILVLGIERATRLLTYLIGVDKDYSATLRLGAATVTDDAEGEVTSRADAAHVMESDVTEGAARLTGLLQQVPSSVSAIKVSGQRSYSRVRAGEDVVLAARPVTVHRFDVLAVRPASAGGMAVLDVDANITCSSGTYVRALARDLGAALGVGGHLTALRRTRVGPYGLENARTLDQLGQEFTVLPMADAARAAFPARQLDEEEARRLTHGQRIRSLGLSEGAPVAAFAPDGSLVALVTEAGPTARPVLVFA